MSGAHWWNGTADTLNAKPTKMNTMARAPAEPTPSRWIASAIPVSTVVLVVPYISDMP